MAVLDNVQVEGLGIDLLDLVRDTFREELWSWFYAHQDDEIFNVRKLWVFSFSVRVKHLRPLFETLLGPSRSRSEN